MNRQQKRDYAKKIKGDKRASVCPLCGVKSLFYSTAELLPYEGTKSEFTKDDFKVVVKCEVCGGTVLDSPAVTKLIQPGIYLPLPLDIFTLALQHEEADEEDAETTDEE